MNIFEKFRIATCTVYRGRGVERDRRFFHVHVLQRYHRIHALLPVRFVSLRSSVERVQ